MVLVCVQRTRVPRWPCSVGEREREKHVTVAVPARVRADRRGGCCDSAVKNHARTLSCDTIGVLRSVKKKSTLRMMLEYKTKNAKEKNMSLCYKVCRNSKR